jgi:hypothetical protein
MRIGSLFRSETRLLTKNRDRTAREILASGFRNMAEKLGTAFERVQHGVFGLHVPQKLDTPPKPGQHRP